MRIISGKWKGRKLYSLMNSSNPAGLRPTLDRVRESIFNLLTHRNLIKNERVRVLDLFSGTGAFGFEALSRGVDCVCFVEIEKSSLKILKENAARLETEVRVKIIDGDATKLGRNDADRYDLIFLDPPYGKHLGELALESALKGGWISDEAIVIWEEKVDIFPPKGFILTEKRIIGKINVNFLIRE